MYDDIFIILFDYGTSGKHACIILLFYSQNKFNHTLIEKKTMCSIF